MIDLNLLREQPERFRDACIKKAVDPSFVARVIELDTKRREHKAQIDEINRKRNIAAKEKDIEGGKALKASLGSLEGELRTIEQDLRESAWKLPNPPTEDTPVGKDESGNIEVRRFGAPKEFAFKPKEHWEIGQALGLIDSEQAVEVSGSRFTYLKGDLAMLQFALLQFVLGTLTSAERLQEIISRAGLSISAKPFIPVVPPVLMKEEVMHRMGRLEPKDDRYAIPSDNLYLVGSAEHTLGPLHMDETLKEAQLPLRYVAFTPAFRREAGSYGKDVHGILRLHQFDKIEMEVFSTVETSLAEQELLVALQEYFLQSLEIPYRVMAICTGDMGKPDARQFDLEAWMPGQGTYRETHTADCMTDYQARRLETRYKNAEGKSVYVHMNDATALAMGRTLVAILENYQEEDGSVRVPSLLQPYVGKERIQKLD